MPPAGEPVEQSRPEMPTDPESGLVPGKAAEPGHGHQQKWVEEALRRSKTGKKHERLAFEKSPDEGDRVKPGAVLRDQPINLHSPTIPAGASGVIPSDAELC